MPLTTNETVKRVFNTLTWIILLTGLVLLILGLTVHKPKYPRPAIHPSFIVAQDGSGNFTTVSAAVAAAPSHSRKYFGIYIKPGVYREELTVPMEKTPLVFIGGGMGVTIISSNRSSPNEWEATATVAVEGDGFMALDMSIENSGDPTNGSYTVALANYGENTAFQRCSFKGYKGVVRAAKGLHYYGKSQIYGAVDVIWGRAAAIFQKCAVYVEKPLPGRQEQQPAALTYRQRSTPDMTSGFVFHACSVVAAAPGSAAAGLVSPVVFVGRPGGAYSTIVFMESYLGGVVSPSAGWLVGPISPPTTLYMAEYNNGGPGADTGKKKITTAEAARFTVRSFIKGRTWLRKPTIEYVSGFL